VNVGAWTVDPEQNELRRGGESLRLEPKAVDVLCHLARKPGKVVAREELLASVWPGVVVGDDALTQVVIKLRKALGDDAHRPTYIETISKRGYRLIAPVTVEGAAPVASRLPFVRRHRRALGAATTLGVAALAAAMFLPNPAGTARMPWPIAGDIRGAAAASFPTVAVLPLANLSGDPKREYFSDGVTEDIIGALGRFSAVRVMSSEAVRPFKGKSVAPQAIRSELGARYIVHGSVRGAGARLRVAVDLTDAERGVLLWSDRFDGEGAELFEIQDRIVRGIAGKLHVKLTHLEEQRSSAKRAETLEAYDLVLRARDLLRRNERGANREARELLVRARELAPNYGEVYAALGAAEFQRATDGWVENAAAATRLAEDLGKRALATADSRGHSRAHALLAGIYSHQERYEEALAQADRAIELNPNDHHALYWRGSALMCVGRLDEAIAVLETARRYEPQPSPGKGLNLAMAYYAAGRYGEALAHSEAMLGRHPTHSYTHAMRAAALSQLGRREDAALAAGEVRRLNPVFDPDNFGARFADEKYHAKLRDGLRMAGL
jgi:TolB-like protein/DNA-binding winged helix-turn-helix (wHTH) protein